MRHSVIEGLPVGMQESMAAASAAQRERVPEAAAALRGGVLSGDIPVDIRDHAAILLENYAGHRLTEPGFDDVPLSMDFGRGVLPAWAQAFTSFRVPVEGSPNAFGLRPPRAENKANYVAFLAINGLGVNDMVSANTASNANHAAVVRDERDLVVQGGRTLPTSGQGEKLTVDSLLVRNAEALGKGIIGANADNPIVVGAAGDALFFVNGAWQNLAAGVDLTTAQKLRELGLFPGRVDMAVGLGAREGFEVPRALIEDRSKLRQALGGDPGAYRHAIDHVPHSDPEKTNLELALWAQQLMGNVAMRGGITGLDLDTMVGGAAGYIHSSRIHREGPTAPGAMGGGDRNMTAIVPVAAQKVL